MKKKIMGILASVPAVVYAFSASALSAFAEDEETATTAASATAAGGSVFWTLIFPLLIMFVLLYFLAIRPQKKRDNELKEMQSSLEVGDEIVTGGGIVGIVVSAGEDTVVIETGGAKHKLRIKTWAITENVTAQERAKEAKAAAAKKTAAGAGLAAAGLADEGDKKSKDKKKKDKE